MPIHNNAFCDSDVSDDEIHSLNQSSNLQQTQTNVPTTQQLMNPSSLQQNPLSNSRFSNANPLPGETNQVPSDSFTSSQFFQNQKQQTPPHSEPTNNIPSFIPSQEKQTFSPQNSQPFNGGFQPGNYQPHPASFTPQQGHQNLHNQSQIVPPPPQSVDTSLDQNPNNAMNFMSFMQDPNFMQQMALFMQQMQLAQQNGTTPAFLSGQTSPNNGLQNNPSNNQQPPSSFHQQPENTVPSSQQQQQSRSVKSKSSKTKNDGTAQPSSIPQKNNANDFSGARQEVYILVLGETGVGKSTWINGIANYMSFDVITEALEAPEPVCVIPSKFTICDDDYQQREIIIGNSANEVFDKGQSATQDTRTYLFQTAKYDVYIIDTPGIGDVRGIEQDKENTRKILNAIAAYKNLHAICLLFKSNDARMTLSFRYCISELLLQLHRDAAKNIVFFFTNSRGTFYKPGDTIVPLRAFLETLQAKHEISVSLNKKNIFCLDNEAFKFVCAFHDGVEFSEEDMLNFASSWKRSADETNRFLDYAASCKPHSVDKTLSVNQARGIILQLAKPLADINDLIETNIKVYNDRKNEIENTAATIDELNKKLLIPQVGMKTEPLPYPMTVCTGEKCIETQSIPNSEQRQTIYKQICHDHCQLENVDPERFPEPHLQQCWAMQGSQNCHECGCQWSVHMHIRFKQVKTSESVEDENIKNAIQTNEDARITKQKIIESCEKMVKEYKHEQKIIMEASIRFAVFLKQNAIMAYNDVFEKYVEKSIEEEEKCIKAGGDHSKLNNLKRCLDEYRQERAAIEQAIQNGGNDAQQISTDDVKKMKSQLFSLPHFGAKLKELFNRTVQGYALNQQQSVQKFEKPIFDSYSSGKKSKKSSKNYSVMDKLRNVFGGQP